MSIGLYVISIIISNIGCVNCCFVLSDSSGASLASIVVEDEI